MIYLDYNATSPYTPNVKKFIQGEMIEKWANPSSEYVEGAYLADEIKLVRAEIAEFLGCSTKGLIFTSGATESINTVLSIEHLETLKIKRIISSPMEHHATLGRLKYLQNKGFEILYINHNHDGVFELDHYQELIEGPKTLVTLMFANNETGVINPVKKLIQRAHEKGHLVHLDAVQALCKTPFSLDELNVDFASFSAHKIGAMKGVGLLFVKDLTKFKPLIHGGGQERGYRPGTLNYPGIKSFSLAIKDRELDRNSHILELREKLEENLLKIHGLSINCQSSPRLANTISMCLPSSSSGEVLRQLARKGIYVATGSACSSGSFEPSHVMMALGHEREKAKRCLRISLGSENSLFDIDSFYLSLRGILNSNT